MRTAGTWCALVALLLPCSLAAAGQERETLAVLGLRALNELSADRVATLDEVLLTAFQEAGRHEVLGSSDIASIMSLEEQRVQVTGCADDSCLADIGGALGVSWLAAATIGTIGDQFVLSLKLLAVDDASVAGRVTRNFPRDEDRLIGEIRGAVTELLGGGAAAPAPPAGAGRRGPGDAPAAGAPTTVREAARPAAGSGVGPWPWVTLGLTVAAAGTAGALAGLAVADRDAMDQRYQGNDDWAARKSAAETKALAADVLFGVAGAAAVTTLVLFLLELTGDEPAPASVGVRPTAGGGLVIAELQLP